jgi:protoporphyrinogen oxidase
MEKIAIIGAGISGLSISQCLKNNFQIKIFEKEDSPGGLIKCENVNGNLYHPVGGHVFNSKNKEVLDWFWQYFDKDVEFLKANRNAVVLLNAVVINYPIENYAYMMSEETIRRFIKDLLKINRSPSSTYSNFEEFLKENFGETLYQLYFKPYNEKIWQRKLSDVPLSWLEGKLPMPSIEDMIYNNFMRVNEKNMVHSSFYYPVNNGSQFIADRLVNGLDISYRTNIEKLKKYREKWVINNDLFDKVIFCGNIKDLPNILCEIINIKPYIEDIQKLEYHGTTSVLCEIDKNPYSWIYLPDRDYSSHRIICTGNFSPQNNAENKFTSTIEFTDYVEINEIYENLQKMPFNPKYLAHRYTKYTYPIQSSSTKEIVNNIKYSMEKENFYLLGRFAEWEYYNMDTAIASAMKLFKKIKNKKVV